MVDISRKQSKYVKLVQIDIHMHTMSRSYEVTTNLGEINSSWTTACMILLLVGREIPIIKSYRHQMISLDALTHCCWVVMTSRSAQNSVRRNRQAPSFALVEHPCWGPRRRDLPEMYQCTRTVRHRESFGYQEAEWTIPTSRGVLARPPGTR